jgi:hypothetical protein
MDGLRLAQLLRERFPQLPIVLVTGYAVTSRLPEITLPVLRKPYQLAEVSRTLAKVIAESRQPRPTNVVHFTEGRAVGSPSDKG